MIGLGLSIPEISLRKIVASISGTFYRLTENGNTRITESGNTRIREAG